MTPLTLEQQTVGELVAERPSRSRVFERFGIDYCCGGGKPLQEACASNGVDTKTVLEALAEADARSAGGATDEVDPKSMALAALSYHIEQTHHAYLKDELPRLSQMVHKVASVHGERYPWMNEVDATFSAFREELESHMMKEERILFPLIRHMETTNALPETLPGGSVENPIRMMRHEHDSAAQALHRMKTLSNTFTPPDDACNTFRATLDGLRQLESDTYRHIHKENNVLFPRAAELESSLR